MKYRLLGLDLDGTLLNERGIVSEANRLAVAAARERGVLVVPCTGRGWQESKEPMQAIFGDVMFKEGSHTPASSSADLPQPGVFNTGAAVCDVRSGRSLDLACIEPHVALRIVEVLQEMPEAVLVFRDLSAVGHDYLVTGQGSLTPNTQWWFQRSGATVHYQRQVSVEDLRHSLRVGIVAGPARMEVAKAKLRETVGDKIFFHSFEAVQMPVPSESMHILEIFAAGVDKWRGLSWVAQAHDIAPEEIACIGDEVNDLQMLRGAGCGIAMGNGIAEAKAAAKHVTRSHREDGVAYAIQQLLSGHWN